MPRDGSDMPRSEPQQQEPEGPIGKQWMAIAQKAMAQRDAATAERSNMQLHYELMIDDLRQELNDCQMQLATMAAELDTARSAVATRPAADA